MQKLDFKWRKQCHLILIMILPEFLLFFLLCQDDPNLILSVWPNYKSINTQLEQPAKVNSVFVHCVSSDSMNICKGAERRLFYLTAWSTTILWIICFLRPLRTLSFDTFSATKHIYWFFQKIRIILCIVIYFFLIVKCCQLSLNFTIYGQSFFSI